MRRLISAAAVLLMLLQVHAADEAKPNTLTPREIADGWLLLFDGESTFGWKIDGEAVVKDGTLVLGGDKETTATFATQFRECDLRFQYAGERTPDVKLSPVVGQDEAYPLSLLPKKGKWCEASVSIRRKEGVSGSLHEVIPAKSDVVVTHGHVFLTRVADGDTFPNLHSRVQFQVPKGVRISLRDIKLQPTDLKPVFNGKDLSGWKEHPGKKSQFSVDDGTIRIKNGPGDLQTEGQWDDFVLQIECKTNGKHLNSGVFFRCRPSEYQQGYEAQIHNGFAEQPTKEYTVETYDPESGKVIDSKKVKSAALDYGTGGIYRRVPARRQAAKDNEWFTMTVVADGRHIATWVNGVLTADWTDTRPLKDNARNGCRLEKGPISLQGHDPTTDLNFRNIRIAELPKAEKK
jgi:hypothetical protein